MQLNWLRITNRQIENTSWRWGTVTILAVLAVGLGFSFAHESYLAVIILVSLPFLGIIFYRPEIGLWALFVVVFMFDWLAIELHLLPQQATWLSEILIVGIFFGVLSRKLVRRQRFLTTPLDLPILFLILNILVSALLNALSLPTLLVGVRSYLKYILLFYAVVNLPLSLKWEKLFIWVLIIATFLQVPVSILQRILTGQRDKAGGTIGFNATQDLTILIIIVICILLSLIIYRQISPRWSFALFVLFVPPVFGEARAFFFLLPIALLVLFLQNPANIFRSLLLLLFLASVYWIAVRSYPTQTALVPYLENPLLLLKLEESYAKGGELARVGAFNFANQMVWGTKGGGFLGAGPGSASPSFFSLASGELYQAYQRLRPFRIVYSKLVLELGYLGLVILSAIFFRMFVSAISCIRNAADRFWQAFGFAYVEVLLLFALSVFYINWVDSDVLMFVFWILTAVVIRVSKLSPKTGIKVYREARENRKI